MPLRDYAEEDEAGHYGQNFNKEGVVSVWASRMSLDDHPDALDVLQDYCGVGAYDPDFTEANNFQYKVVPIRSLLSELSFATSFMDEVEKVAVSQGLGEASWVVVQYDFEYDRSRVKRVVHPDITSLGAFKYTP